MNEKQTVNENPLEMRLKELELEFQTIEAQIDKVVKESNEKITEYKKIMNKIYQEGQAEVDKLMTRREQVRGAYTELIKIVHPEIVQSQPEVTPQPESVSMKSVSVEDVNETNLETSETPQEQIAETHNPESTLTKEQDKKIKQVEDKQIAEKQNKSLTQEEIDKISKQFNNISDIPDYLQEEYNK